MQFCSCRGVGALKDQRPRRSDHAQIGHKYVEGARACVDRIAGVTLGVLCAVHLAFASVTLILFRLTGGERGLRKHTRWEIKIHDAGNACVEWNTGREENIDEKRVAW